LSTDGKFRADAPAAPVVSRLALLVDLIGEMQKSNVAQPAAVAAAIVAVNSTVL